MRRIIFFIAVFYLAALGILDMVAYDGRYSRAVWNQASYQFNRTHAEIQIMLDRIGIGTRAVARP